NQSPNFTDADQLLCFCNSLELFLPKLRFLVRSAIGGCLCIELVPHDLLIDHPNDRSIRSTRQVHPAICQDRHQNPFEPERCCPQTTLSALSPRIARWPLCGSGSGLPVHNQCGGGFTVLILLRALHFPERERKLHPLPSAAVLAHGEPGIEHPPAELALA